MKISPNHLVISEIFGPTIQGEGKSVGRRCGFLRLGFCNLHCRWCDTAFTWRFNDSFEHVSQKTYNIDNELTEMTFEETIEKIRTLDVDFLVISGGEPLLQADALNELLSSFVYRKDRPEINRIEMETAGTIEPIKFDYLSGMFKEGIFYNVSPKLSNSGNKEEYRYNKKVLERFLWTERAIFKFVVTSPQDMLEIKEIQTEVGIPNELIYIMAEGTDIETQETRMKEIIPAVINQGWNITPRLHVQLWGNKRGV